MKRPGLGSGNPVLSCDEFEVVYTVHPTVQEFFLFRMIFDQIKDELTPGLKYGC